MAGSRSLGHIDIVRSEDLQELATHDGPCVSVFLPTARHGPDTLEGPVRLRNLLRQVETDLEGPGVDRATVDEILEPLRALVDDAPFWQHQSDGLALYASTAVIHRHTDCRDPPLLNTRRGPMSETTATVDAALRLVATSTRTNLDQALTEVRDDLIRQITDAKNQTEPRNNRRRRETTP